VDAEVLKEEHSAPVIESGLFKPGVAIEIGRDACPETVAEGVCGVESTEHFMGDLRVARLVSPDEAEAIAAEDRRKAIEKKEKDETENYGYFGDSCPGGQTSARCRLLIWRSRFHQFSLHVQNSSK
jgi:hypothetical protein